MEYDVSTEDFLKHGSNKSRSVTRSQVKGIAIDNSPKYTYMAKRFNCPGCGTNHWVEVLNYNEYQSQAKRIVLKYALIVFAGLYLLMQGMMVISKLFEKIFG